MAKQTKTRSRARLWLKICLLLLLIYPAWRLGYGCYRELSYYLTEPSEAQAVVKAYAQEKGIAYSAYPESLIALLERNPEAETFVVEYPIKKDTPQHIDLSEYQNSDSVPLFLQWDQRWGYMTYGDDIAGITGCGPVCLSMAAFYLTGDEAYSPDKMIDFAAENGYYAWGVGSSWTLISEGAAELGFDVTEIPLDKNRIIKNLEVDNPIICVMGPGDFTTTGHYIVMTGCQDGLIRVNDPNSVENSQTLWSYEQISSQIRNLWVIRK